jgi:hypothetical protein
MKILQISKIFVLIVFILARFNSSEAFNIKTLENFWKITYSASVVNEISTTETGIKTELLLKANPDECFKGIGKNEPYDEALCSDGMPRVNESYPWSMAASEKNVWFSTFTNLVCGVLSARGVKIPIITDIPTFNGVKVCEKGFDNYKTSIGTSRPHWRPPHIY